jgi:Holliday junction resolvasome RuvABC endonuclease subunit
VPHEVAERTRLRELCRQALAFENHYFGLYRRYLLAELEKRESTRVVSALHRLAQVVYTDEEVREAVRTAGASSNEEVQRAVRGTLERLDDVGSSE